ncbi:eukaryotic peptide chain release factor GTP-binding subunit ERF3A-like isoform X2 [Xenia sp. Carnegie-2017]|uniref:eukaryotic peptide chain release factor GTP-binding subunit ERF3A-like isoform X2 n=1 Tax=Xenia sp. Carnegie-2017 TaxID=2897299 RepID=UPI001F04E9AF|nr:eukaryotic peptide chain release factor GTP-binding subunit ERF3A-like isoform X2 [Xenia sp. Carnegie-2017]
MMDEDFTPDSWDACDDSNIEINNGVKSLNVGAKPFVPNINAPVFVPSFSQKTTAADDLSVSDSVKSINQDYESITDLKKSEVMNGEKLNNEPSNEVNNASKEDEKPIGKSKKPQIMPEIMKEHINIVFIGHVDAGKSTIGGQVLYLTGQVDKRTLEKYEREAKEKNRETWYLSWALDTNQEERDKGKTVEVGRAQFETENKKFTLLDAPGHKSFVPNMIGGAAQADLGVLVISARKGEFETGFERGGQTREHAMLAKTAGVKHLVILINKMDDPTVEWEKSRYDECKEKLVPFLKKVGFNPKTDVHFMPCSGLTGANIKQPLDQNVCSWYSGKPFLTYIDNLPNLQRSNTGPVRLPIAEKYKEMGTMILGKLESGTISKGQTLVMMPNKVSIEVMTLYSDDCETTQAYCGENIKAKLKGIEEEDISPGFVLCEPSSLCHTVKMFNAQVVILEHKSIICSGYSCVLHIHNVVEEVTLIGIIALLDKKTGKKSQTHPRFVKQDQICIAKFQTDGIVCMETFAEFPQMGRFTLRDEGKTVAIGKVLKLKQ